MHVDCMQWKQQKKQTRVETQEMWITLYFMTKVLPKVKVNLRLRTLNLLSVEADQESTGSYLENAVELLD